MEGTNVCKLPIHFSLYICFCNTTISDTNFNTLQQFLQKQKENLLSMPHNRIFVFSRATWKLFCMAWGKLVSCALRDLGGGKLFNVMELWPRRKSYHYERKLLSCAIKRNGSNGRTLILTHICLAWLIERIYFTYLYDDDASTPRQKTIFSKQIEY